MNCNVNYMYILSKMFIADIAFAASVCMQSRIHDKIHTPYITHMLPSCLQDEEKEELLDGLLAGTLAFSEAETASEELKAFTTTRDVFLKEMQLETWAEAESAFPDTDVMAELKKIRVQKGKSPPKSFNVSSH